MSGNVRSLADRLFDNCIPEPNSGCWIWGGTANPLPGMMINRKKINVRKEAFEQFVGPLRDPKDKVKMRCGCQVCINPDHMEAIPVFEGFCINGHELNDKNSRIAHGGGGGKYIKCLICSKESWRKTVNLENHKHRKIEIRKKAPKPAWMNDIRKCKFCEKAFCPTQKKQIFCTKSCGNKDFYGNPKPNSFRPCVVCGHEFRLLNSKKQFCSSRCYQKNLRDTGKKKSA